MTVAALSPAPIEDNWHGCTPYTHLMRLILEDLKLYHSLLLLPKERTCGHCCHRVLVIRCQLIVCTRESGMGSDSHHTNHTSHHTTHHTTSHITPHRTSHHTTPHYTTLHHTTPHHTTPHHTTPHHTTPHHTTLHSNHTTLHYITLHYTPHTAHFTAPPHPTTPHPPLRSRKRVGTLSSTPGSKSHLVGAPGRPLPARGFNTADLSHCRRVHWSTRSSWRSISTWERSEQRGWREESLHASVISGDILHVRHSV